MSLTDVDDQIKDSQSAAMLPLKVLSLVVVSKVQFKLLVEELVAFFRDNTVVFDGLKEEPRRIPTVESSVVASIVEIGKQSMSVDLGKVQNGVSSILLETSNNQKTSQSDERVAAPASHVASGEVSKTSAHRVLMILEEGRWYSTVHLIHSKSHLLRERIETALQEVIKDSSLHHFLNSLVKECLNQLSYKLWLKVGWELLDELHILPHEVGHRTEPNRWLSACILCYSVDAIVDKPVTSPYVSEDLGAHIVIKFGLLKHVHDRSNSSVGELTVVLESIWPSGSS